MLPAFGGRRGLFTVALPANEFDVLRIQPRTAINNFLDVVAQDTAIRGAALLAYLPALRLDRRDQFPPLRGEIERLCELWGWCSNARR